MFVQKTEEAREMVVEINGIKIFVRIKGQGKPFLILHGWGANADSWLKVQNILSKDFQVIVLDLPGFGRSDLPPRVWGLDDYKDFVFKFLKKMKLEKINVAEQQNELDRMRMEFTAQASQLENSLEIIIKSEELYKQSILDKEELLNIAKVGYKSDRMSIEDYLKYEDDLLLEKSNLYKIQAQKWATLMKLAVIYGNNIEEIVK